MKTAIVLLNLGGPDSQEAVRPFLFNLFNDPAIIGVPNPLRYLLAQLISRRRAPIAREIYAQLGGGSPLLPNTRAQAEALDAALGEGSGVKSFIAMRYWHPMAAETVRDVAAFKPDRVLLLPLYPQFSSTTTGSSFEDWDRAAARAGLKVPTIKLCCYPWQDGFVEAVADLIRKGLAEASAHGAPRLLFSAHGLPKKIVDKGDPYQWQVEGTAAAVVNRLAIPDLDWGVCYQSRVGPLEWIKPSTDNAIEEAAVAKKPIVICPIAFVSEHSETLVEIEIEYRELALEKGAPAFVRVPAVATHPAYIAGLADAVRAALARNAAVAVPDGGQRFCPAKNILCPSPLTDSLAVSPKDAPCAIS
jgi:protoporphyrin/coproporphyrin ferrochelatase